MKQYKNDENISVCKRKVIFEKYKRNLILGLKGSSFLEAGYIFAPYIPVFETQTVNESFNPSEVLASRYATKLIDNNLYGAIAIK